MIIHVYDGKWEGDTIYPDIQKAYNRMKNLFACGDLELPAKIVVHEGTYRLTQPLHFSEEFPVTIEAAEGEKPVLSGAMEITAFPRSARFCRRRSKTCPSSTWMANWHRLPVIRKPIFCV